MADFYGSPPWKVVEDYSDDKPRVYVVDAHGNCVFYCDSKLESREKTIEKCEDMVRRFNETAGPKLYGR